MSVTTVLVCGASGYVGGRLVPSLLEEGGAVSCLVRSPEKMSDLAYHGHPNLTVIEGALDDQEKLRQAADGVDAAYYLVHAMISAGDDYDSHDRELAQNFIDGLHGSGCKRIIYLGGLGEMGPDLSKHLRSRRAVAEILQSGDVPATVLRAAMIIGSGSASFEILRYLVDRLPIMITPKWVNVETQPIAIRDVLRYLVQCLQVPETSGKVIDIGGADILTYREMMQVMAVANGLSKRLILPVPVLTPRLSSGWISLVTPVNARIARPLAEGLRNRRCRNDTAEKRPGPLEVERFRQRLENLLLVRLKHVGPTRVNAGDPLPGNIPRRTLCRGERVMPQFRALCKIGGKYGYWGLLFSRVGWTRSLVAPGGAGSE